jgi:hypothetical protein
MRLEYTKIVAQTVRDRNPVEDRKEPIGISYGRASKLAEIEEAALEFASDFLLDYDLPSSPIFRLGNIKGFENPKLAVKEIKGVVHVTAEFATRSAHLIRLSLAIPFYKGEFQRPSIVYYNNKRKVFSQELIDEIVDSVEHTRPVVSKPMTPAMNFRHEEVVERQLFSPPNDPSGWSMLVTERY